MYFSYRYAEQVSPLVILAQHKLSMLTEEQGGERPPQRAFRDAVTEHDGPVTSHVYLDLQLRVTGALDTLVALLTEVNIGNVDEDSWHVPSRFAAI